MAFTPKKQAFNASINAVTLGTGDKSIVIGGENVLPFYTFDAPMDISGVLILSETSSSLSITLCPASV